MWADALRLAVREFHIPPQAFWKLSLAEWRMLTATIAGPVLDRSDFNALMRKHPDDFDG